MAAGNGGGIHRKGFGTAERRRRRRLGVLPFIPPDLLTPLDASYSARGGRQGRVRNWVVVRRTTATYTVPRVRTLVEDVGGPTPIDGGDDPGTGVESQSLTVAVLQIETYSGNDLQTLAAALASTDTYSGVESQSLGILQIDTYSGVDLQSLAAALASTDTYSGVDLQTLAAALASTDSGGGLDGGQVSEDRSPTDLDISFSSEAVVARTLSTTDNGTGVEAEGILFLVRFLVGGDVVRAYESEWIRKVAKTTALSAFTGGHPMEHPQDWESNLVDRMRRRRGV